MVANDSDPRAWALDLKAGDAVWTEYPDDKRLNVYPASILAVRGQGQTRAFQLKFGRTSAAVEFFDPEWVTVAEMITLVRWHDGPSTLALTDVAIDNYLPTFVADFRVDPPARYGKRLRNQTVQLDNSPRPKKKKDSPATPARAPAARAPAARANRQSAATVRCDWDYDAAASVDAIDGVYQALATAKQAFVPIKETLDAAKRVISRTPPTAPPPPMLSD